MYATCLFRSVSYDMLWSCVHFQAQYTSLYASPYCAPDSGRSLGGVSGASPLPHLRYPGLVVVGQAHAHLLGPGAAPPLHLVLPVPPHEAVPAQPHLPLQLQVVVLLRQLRSMRLAVAHTHTHTQTQGKWARDKIAITISPFPNDGGH